MLHSYTSYCYFLMVKESMVSCAQRVLEYLERNSKRYTGKQKPPAKLNEHFFPSRIDSQDVIRDASVRDITQEDRQHHPFKRRER